MSEPMTPFRDCPAHDPNHPENGLRFDLGQAWRSQPDADFAAAWVHLSWSPTHLHIHAELDDHDIHNAERRHNTRQFEVGDVFEIFLRVLDSEVYHEFHVTPDNAQLNLRFPSSAQFFSTPEDQQPRFLMPCRHGELFTSTVTVDHAAHHWSVQAQIPLALIAEGRPIASGSSLAVSFSRYDYTRGRSEPVYSSSSPHAELRFHRQQEWARIRLV